MGIFFDFLESQGIDNFSSLGGSGTGIVFDGTRIVKFSDKLATATLLDEIAPTTQSIIKYRMRGYFIAGSAYEFWVTTDPTSAPPSGNPLINKIIDSIIS